MVLKISCGLLHARQSVESSRPALAIASFTKNKHLASTELRRAELRSIYKVILFLLKWFRSQLVIYPRNYGPRINSRPRTNIGSLQRISLRGSSRSPAKTDDAPKANEEGNNFWNERPCSCKVNYVRHQGITNNSIRQFFSSSLWSSGPLSVCMCVCVCIKYNQNPN